MRVMVKTSTRLALTFGLLLTLAACARVQPVYTVQDHQFSGQTHRRAQDQVGRAIGEAAQSAGWSVEPLGPGEMRATQKWREHSAIVRIVYTTNGFSILNDGSVNLMSGGNMIHREYNLRVHRLEAAIDARLQRD